MAVEKTFGWLSRFKKIVCAIPPSSIAREVRGRCSLALGSSLDFLEKENVFPFPPRLENLAENLADPPWNRPSETSVVVEVNYHKSTRTVAYDGSKQGNLMKYITRKDWKLQKNLLPWPSPWDRAWMSIQKIIGSLHIRNHEDRDKHPF